MKKIGFKNFKRFTDFPLMEYGPITFLVGRNNSGKSTFVQALLLINNYFQKDRIMLVDFENNILDESNMLTFQRAKNNSNKQDDSISFFFQLNEFEISFQITANEDKGWARVTQLCIKDLKEEYTFQITPGGTYIEKKIELKIGNEDSVKIIDEDLDSIENEIITIKETILKTNFKKSDKEYLSLNSRLLSLQRQLKKRKATLKTINKNYPPKITNKVSYSFDIALDFHGTKISKIAKGVLDEIIYLNELSLNPEEWKDFETEDGEWIRGFKEGYDNRRNIEERLNKLSSLIKNNTFVYIGANSIKPKSLYIIKENSNPLTQAINEYKNLEIDHQPGSPAWSFTRKWMKEFEIGEDFKIIMHAGEAFEFKIISNNIEIPLADKGMGSVQLMMLILRIACVIQKSEYGNGTKTIIVEEPESNLHPALQSKLADMFLYVNQLHFKKQINWKIEFIIETHSEYLIRKTQLLVKENEFEIKPNENPFHVVYFDKDMKQWKMNYREDGKFVEDFGNGFYDESSLLTLNLL